MNKQQWMSEVIRLAKSYGYSPKQVAIFSEEIQNCYAEGMSPEECVSEVF